MEKNCGACKERIPLCICLSAISKGQCGSQLVLKGRHHLHGGTLNYLNYDDSNTDLQLEILWEIKYFLLVNLIDLFPKGKNLDGIFQIKPKLSSWTYFLFRDTKRQDTESLNDRWSGSRGLVIGMVRCSKSIIFLLHLIAPVSLF